MVVQTPKAGQSRQIDAEAIRIPVASRRWPDNRLYAPVETTPQSEPLPGMVPNSAGGHAYPVDDMTRLRRFLILGSEGGSYYADERKLTLENAAAVKRCIENAGPNAVYEIAYISRHGRAPKVGPPLFALAMAATYGHLGTRELAFGYLSQMARTGSQLQMFIDYIGTMRGWGRPTRAPAGCRQLVHQQRYQGRCLPDGQVPAAVQLDPPGPAQEGPPQGC